MKDFRSLLRTFLWCAVVVVLVALIAAGMLTNVTVRSIEKNLPNTLLEQLHDVARIIEELADVVSAAEMTKAVPTSDNFMRLRKKVDSTNDSVVRLRNTYVFDNLIQASAIHAVVAPALADARLWLSEGVSGYGPETETTISVVLSRISRALKKAGDLNRASETKAQQILNEQRDRLDRFLFSVNLLFALAVVITFTMVFLLVFQHVLQRREMQAQQERKRAEEALRESEATLKSIFRVAPIGIGLVADRILRQANDRLCEMTGYSKGELVDSSARMLYTDQEEFDRVGSEKYAQIRQWGTGTIETLWKKKDGAFIDVLLSSTPLDPSNLTAGVTFTALDISERKRAEAALSESQARFRELAELLPETIFEMDVDGTLTFVNRNAYDHFGYSLEDFERGVSGFDMIAPEDRPRAMKNAERVMSGEKIGLNEYKGIRKDGSTFPVVLHSTAKYHDGKPSGIRGIMIDITDTKKLEAQLRRAQKMEAIGTLAGGIAHDFNNILAAIIGYTEMALTDVSRYAPTRQYLEQVLKAGLRAKELVKLILASSRQKQDRERVSTRIAPIVEEALKLLRASLPATIEIRKALESETGAALVDPTEVHQVVVNLCTNAAHAMEERGGVLDVGLAEVTFDEETDAPPPDLEFGDYLRLTVGDTGHGIDPAIRERIFDPYFTTKEVGKGSGLGLAAVHGIMKNYEGAVTVESEPGVGTRFCVYFPRAESMAPEEAPEEEEPLPRGKERILFVDDEEVLVEMGKGLLGWLGYEVTGATGSGEALELFRTEPDRFDMVITDYTMPRMTGVDLAREMMQIRPDIPIVLCTGFSEKITAETVRAEGIRTLAMKPLEMRHIAGVIRNILDETRA